MQKINGLDGFKPVGRNKRKKQIILTHTSRELSEYISSLKYRYNGEYKKLPHYVIGRDGEIYNIVPPNTYTEYFNNDVYMNKYSIIVSLENLGWLRKNPLSNGFVNWIGNRHNNEVFEKKWRGYVFWQPYTDEQMDSLGELVSQLCEEYKIPKRSIGHNVTIPMVDKFNGITTKSNYFKESTDLNPAFDFDIFIKKIGDGKSIR